MIPRTSRQAHVWALGAWTAVVAGCASAAVREDPPSRVPRTPPPSRQDRDEPDLERLRVEVGAAHNRIRAAAKLPALETSERLQAAAQAHARDMAVRRKMIHQGSKGSRPIDRIKATGYPYRRAGENIAAGLFSVDQLMKGWMNSPPHKRNILGGFSQIGVGCAIDVDGKRYWCVTFGLPLRR
ncbi:MAG TPA: CAP domain-containing protein [Isosphaeraceae bacterium]|nr:CAP domain-containing protein [Isosphaeraceae bacterium]